MLSKNQNPKSDKPWSREPNRQPILFWLFWTAFVFLAAILVTALLSGWPTFLHASRSIGR